MSNEDSDSSNHNMKDVRESEDFNKGKNGKRKPKKQESSSEGGYEDEESKNGGDDDSGDDDDDDEADMIKIAKLLSLEDQPG